MTAKTEITKTEVKEEIDDIKNAESNQPKPKEVSGRKILLDYLHNRNTAISSITYKKICNALVVLEDWEAPAKIQFLEQFLDTHDILDNNFVELVNRLLSLEWHKIPDEMLEKFQKFLTDLAVRQVCHTEMVLHCAVTHLTPRTKLDEETKKRSRVFTDEEEDRYFTMAHRIIAHILGCLPLASKALLRDIRSFWTKWEVVSKDLLIPFARNLMQIAEYFPNAWVEIWSYVITQMINCDYAVARQYDDRITDGPEFDVFKLDEEMEIVIDEDKEESERVQRMDQLMCDVLGVITMKHKLPNDVKWLRVGDHINAEEMFRLLLSNLDSQLLTATNVRFVSFLVLYIGSLHESYISRLLDFLWSVICRPHKMPQDAKKAQGAAAYLAAFVARAKYIKADTAFTWLRRLHLWCTKYTEHATYIEGVKGLTTHGTFYSMCQAFFISFCFRYKELVKNGSMEEIRRWSVGRVVHSPFNPLQNVNSAVAQCFASISRSVQLVYCNHLLSTESETTSLSFEPMFPLDSYKLPKSQAFVESLMRRFSPLAEDVAVLTTALNAKNMKDMEEGSMDFLDEDDIGIGRDRNLSQCVPHGQLFTVYSTSPGLCHFDPTQLR